jgi:hypothetical protein
MSADTPAAAPAGYWECDCGRECHDPVPAKCRREWVAKTDGPKRVQFVPLTRNGRRRKAGAALGWLAPLLLLALAARIF